MKIIKSLNNELTISGLAIISYIISLANDFHTDDWRVLSVLRDGFSFDAFIYMDNPGRFRPIVNTILYLRYLFFGDFTPAYYALNIVLNVLFCLLLYKFLLRLGVEKRAAWLASALFAIFFPHYEAVLWLYGINRILAAIFWLICLWRLLLYLEKPSNKNIAIFGAAYLGGFFIAEDFAIAIIGFILFAALFGDKTSRSKSILMTATASVIIMLVYFAMRYFAIGETGTSEEHYSLGFHIVVKIWEYIQWMALPPPGHPYFQSISSRLGKGAYDIWNVASIASGIALIGVLIYALIRGGRATRFFVIFIFLTLLPAMPYDYKVTSRNLYIPSIGLAVAVGILLDKVIGRLKRNSCCYILYAGLMAYCIASMIAIGVTSLTYHKNQRLVAGLVDDLKRSGFEFDKYPYILFDDLPGRAAIGPAIVYYFHYSHDVIVSNDPINGPTDVHAAARDLERRGIPFLVFDYRDGHLAEATEEYKTAK